METISYFDTDERKSTYPPGPWHDEPDKVQWADTATHLPCLAVRGPLGAWCGYVGVDARHPLFGVDYASAEDHLPRGVHGGLTFADHCQPGGEERAICHIPGEGEPDHVWWLGFDCAHAFDLLPAHIMFHRELAERDPQYRRLTELSKMGPFSDTYRPLSYVQGECRELALQLTLPIVRGSGRPLLTA